MDGLSKFPASEIAASILPEFPQRTLAAPISCFGQGLHTGRPVNVRILPAEADSGIAFRRIDLGVTVAATFDRVVDTRLCTVIGAPGASAPHAGTIEHLMAAFAGTEIDNALVEIDGPEVPVFDGSAEPWLFLLDCAGSMAQAASRRVVEVLRPVRVGDSGSYVELRPHRVSCRGGLDLAVSIAFDAPAIGRQDLSLSLTPAAFRDIARARTFALRHEIETMQDSGLALGGSLENAVVIDHETVLNPTGLRMQDEFVRHKMLDAVGDLALAGAALRGRFIGTKSGHRLNCAILQALFSNPANYRLVTPAEALLAA